MSSPRDLSPRARRRARFVRMVSLGLVVVAGGGLIGLSPLTEEPAVAADGPLTLRWADNSSLGAPGQGRATDSPHFSEMKDLTITVSQTTGIVDQTVQVDVSGFAVGVGTQSTPTSYAPAASNAKNYLQAMQCWGDPSDVAFRESCQWGGRYGEGGGLGESVIPDNAFRVAEKYMDVRSASPIDNPFMTEQGRSVSGKPQIIEKETKYPIRDYFTAATTNEVTSARVGDKGTGSFDFEVQTADQAPQLNCGSPERLRCYLVIVPRGTVFGGAGEECSNVTDPRTGVAYTKGTKGAVQGGSPVSPGCDYWDNRIVVPLDFAAVGSTCEVGSAEQRVVGSQLMIGAMSSWQPDLCSRLQTAYSFSTNPDSVARRQLLEGTATVAYAGLPLSPGELETNDERQVLADSDLAYAPVAVSGVSIAFQAESIRGRETELRLSPRLVAKLLTQSYPFQIPTSGSDPLRATIAHLPAANQAIRLFNQDPEFVALNPSNFQYFSSQNPGVILPGPASGDALRQVWRWILADADAVAFLNGAPGPGGISINPYYLPKGDPAAVAFKYNDLGQIILKADGTPDYRQVGLAKVDGSPLRLSETPLELFPRADETRAPLILDKVEPIIGPKFPFDSITWAPYAENFLSGARQAFRADPNSKTIWDPTKPNPSSGTNGDWASSGVQITGQKFMIAITDTPSSRRYGLTDAAIGVPNSAAFVTPTSESFADALPALAPTSVPSVKQVDPAAVVGTGYPLTMVTYAEVNLSRSSADDRAAISSLIKQVTTTGQVSGTAPGQLPFGYLPITAEMAKQSAVAAVDIASYVPDALPDPGGPTTDSSAGTTTNGIAQDDFEVSSSAAATSDADPGVSDPAADASVTPGSESAEVDGRTEAVDASAIARGGLAASLGLGVLGTVFGPILFRGRGFA